MPGFAEEISKLLPVRDIYQDALQPAARQVGEIGSHGVGIDKINIDDLAIALMKTNANTKLYAEEATSSLIEEINGTLTI